MTVKYGRLLATDEETAETSLSQVMRAESIERTEIMEEGYLAQLGIPRPFQDACKAKVGEVAFKH